MTDPKQKPERFEAAATLTRFSKENGNDYETFITTGLAALETISAQLDYLITMMYGQKQEEHHDET